MRLLVTIQLALFQTNKLFVYSYLHDRRKIEQIFHLTKNYILSRRLNIHTGNAELVIPEDLSQGFISLPDRKLVKNVIKKASTDKNKKCGCDE